MNVKHRNADIHFLGLHSRIWEILKTGPSIFSYVVYRYDIYNWMMSLFTWSVISSEDVLLVYLYGGFFNFRNVFYMKTEFI